MLKRDLGAKRGCKGLFVSTLESEYNFRKCLGYFGMARGLKTFVRIQKKNHIRWSSDGGDSVGVPTRGSGSQLVNAACFLVPDVDARGNTVMHGFILVPATGPYVQQRGVRGHCIILHPECL